MDNLAGLENMVARLLLQFDPPRKGWAKMAADVLSDIPSDALIGAADLVIKTRKFPSFPSVAEILEAAETWMHQKRQEEIRHSPRAIDGQEQSTEREQLANMALETETGQTAADEGWAAGLWQYVYNHGEMPGAAEQAAIRREQEAQRRAAAQLTKYGLVELHDGMERQFAKMARGE